NRRADGQARAQPQVHGRRAEQEPEQDANDDRFEGEFRRCRAGRDVRLEGGGRLRRDRGHRSRILAFATIRTSLVKGPNKATPRAAAGRQTVDSVSELTTNRLSVYLRCLSVLEHAGVRTISSQALAEQFHLNAAQIRKDLA